MTKIVIAGVLVGGMLFAFLFTAMLLREREEANLRARAPRPAPREPRSATPPHPAPAPPDRPADQRRRTASGGARAPGGGLIISGFDTGGARVRVAVRSTAFQRGRWGVCFGRDPSVCEFTIPDDAGTLSRRHFRIRLREPGAFEIEDLGSMAGLKVNGDKLRPFEPRPLRLPAKIDVGGRTVLDALGGEGDGEGGDIRTVLVGRHSDCDVVFSDETVSRFHAELVFARNGRLFLVDRQSTQGTWRWRGGWERLDRADYVGADERLRFGAVETSAGELARRVRG